MKLRSAILVAGFAFAGTAAAAIAQAPPTAATPPAQTAPSSNDHAGTNCAPTQTTPQGNVVPNGTTGQNAGNLGDKLAKSDGVLCPPGNVDPAMRAPAPNADSSNTPVIPPPGSPGGDQSVRPK